VKERSVAIFWLINDNLVFDCTPIEMAETDRRFKNHSSGHDSVWGALQQSGKAPADMEYEEATRGRVIFDGATQQFAILADRCVLRRKTVIEAVKKEMHLPKTTQAGPDSHYRCLSLSAARVKRLKYSRH
jgi:hypothetical protein